MATIFPIAQFISVQCFDFYEFYVEFGWGSFTVTWVEFMVIYFAIVANITAIQRGIITWKNMSKQEDVFGTQETKAAFEGEIVGQGENTMDVRAGEPVETVEAAAEPPEDKQE
jgi:hypothetical protein